MLRILTFPNDQLRKKSVKVKQSKLEPVQKLVDKMFETMRFYKGIGLAAPQVGVHLRVIVIDLNDKKTPELVMINPEILSFSGKQTGEEACLSLPYGHAPVKRFDTIKVQYLDYHGEVRELSCSGLLSRCIQHEIDHLDGKLYIDHLSKLRREIFENKAKKGKRKFISQQEVMLPKELLDIAESTVETAESLPVDL